MTDEFEIESDSPQCCGKCRDEWERGKTLHQIIFTQRMILCPKCGNKRCPKAHWHKYQCTGSNEPKQVGTLENRE